MSRTGRRVVAALILAVVALFSLPSRPASAHAVLVGSSPAENEVVESTPAEIVLQFSEPVELLENSLVVLDASGAAIDAGPVDQSRGSDTIVLHVEAELDGSVVVSWRAVSIDSHVISGAYTFAVGARTDVDPELIPAGRSIDTAWPDRWLGLGRWATYLGVAGVVGGIGVLAWLAPTVLAERRTLRLLRSAALLGAAGTAAMLAAQSSLIADGPFDTGAWGEVIDLTSGRWWLARLVAFGATLVGLAVVPGRATRAWFALAGFAAVTLVPTTVAGGHALTGDHVAVALVSTTIHVAAMALWVGGLALLGMTIARRDLPAVFTRFSPLGLACAGVLVLTGVVNSWRQLGSTGDLFDTSFGRWLVIKLVVVVLVLGAAAFNRLSLRGAADDVSVTALRLRRGVRLESIGMVVVLAATAGLSNATPPDSVPSTPQPVSVTATRDDARARIDVIPARTGGTTLNVMIYAVDTDLTAADEITVEASLPSEELGPITLEVDTVGPNQLTTDGADFPAAGDWTVEITARFGEFDQTVFTAPVTID